MDYVKEEENQKEKKYQILLYDFKIFNTVYRENKDFICSLF